MNNKKKKARPPLFFIAIRTRNIFFFFTWPYSCKQHQCKPDIYSIREIWLAVPTSNHSHFRKVMFNWKMYRLSQLRQSILKLKSCKACEQPAKCLLVFIKFLIRLTSLTTLTGTEYEEPVSVTAAIFTLCRPQIEVSLTRQCSYSLDFQVNPSSELRTSSWSHKIWTSSGEWVTL